MIGFTLLTSEFLRWYKEGDRVRYILDNIKKGKIVVLEGELTPSEYNMMIENVLRMVDNEFFGFEMEKIEVKKGVLKKTSYTIIKPRISGFELMLKQNPLGLDIIAEAKMN